MREAKQSDEFGRFVERSVEEIRSAVADERAQHAAMVTCQPKLAELAQLRGILVEGIVKNQFAFALDVHTTSLAVKFLDRFLGADRFAAGVAGLDLPPRRKRVPDHRGQVPGARASHDRARASNAFPRSHD